ncbi:MAG TPA: amino acid--tRNA ligase-related protein, partial [Gammaproteobacteria bacterium]|nr:amino acid--tRNA ligase-related protein [Gammaproteobacteria bacterium]
MLKNNWRPTASIDVLKERAKLYQEIGHFFAQRDVWEVETPLLGLTNSPDPHIEPFTVHMKNDRFCLQTSPEFYMKRLLAAGSGSIYQMCKAFRKSEIGRNHNPEFTMLEWYHVGWTHEELIHEVEELLRIILNVSKIMHFTYSALFQEFLAINPLHATEQELKQKALALYPH